jgi:DNA-binding GntR family transcriptional regulator
VTPRHDGDGAAASLPFLQDTDRLQDRVRTSLRDAVADGSLEAGELYSVQQLADALGVSRSPVREALITLAQQGMVRFERNRGVRVLETSIHDIEEIFVLRLLLEVPATFRAVESLSDQSVLEDLGGAYAAMSEAAKAGDEQSFMRHDIRFHDVLLVESGNLRLAEYVRNLRELVLNKGSSTTPRRTLEDILSEHDPIMRHAEARDELRAEEAMRAHILNTARLLLEREGGSAETFEKWAALVAPERGPR